MDDDTRAVLEVESDKGVRARVAWETYIEPFFNKKTSELFEAFKIMPTTKPDDLMLVKMQLNALESMKDELQEHINTGILATKALNDEEAPDVH